MSTKFSAILLVVTMLTSIILSNISYAEATLPSNRAIDPIVSTNWLKANLAMDRLVIIDIRSSSEYEEGHITNAINLPFDAVSSAWATSTDDLILELPKEADLFKVIGDCGITEESLVVIVTTVEEAPAPPYTLANATRVADTLIYAGIKNVAILDGGYSRWIEEGKAITTEIPEMKKVVYSNRVNNEMFVSTEYVQKHIGKSVIIDARDADVYFGIAIESFAQKAGHIPTARSLPTPWMWKEDGTYKPIDVLEEMASGVINEDKDKEVIIYCGVGGYASSWWFILTQVLGYENVKIYDGAAQAWVKDNFMIPYRWTF